MATLLAIAFSGSLKYGGNFSPDVLEVSYSKSFEANSEKTSWSLFGAGASGGAFGGAGWSISKNLSLDMVARDVVVQVANALAEELAKHKIVERPKLPKEEKKEERKREEYDNNNP